MADTYVLQDETVSAGAGVGAVTVFSIKLGVVGMNALFDNEGPMLCPSS